MLASYPINNGNIVNTIFFVLANLVFVLWEDSDDKGWIYSLGVLMRTLVGFGFLYQTGQEPEPITLACLMIILSLSYLNNVIVLALTTATIALLYCVRTLYTKMTLVNITAIFVIIKYLQRVYDMKIVYNR